MNADVEANVLYIERTAAKPYSYEYDPPAGTPRRSASYREHQVRIRNARELQRQPMLDQQGFELVSRASAVNDFYDPAQIRSVYYPELVSLVRSATGASSAVVFDHTLRTSRKEERIAQEPVGRVHNDYTPESAIRRLRDVVTPARADELLRHRFIEVNVWRPIRGPLKTKPLAILDSSSAAPDDFIACDLIYRERRGEIFYVAHRAQHQWYYYPDMERDEALLIKGYDSDPERARFAAHAAFDDPSTPADALPRESIEARLFAFFAPDVPSLSSRSLIQFR